MGEYVLALEDEVFRVQALELRVQSSTFGVSAQRLDFSVYGVQSLGFMA